MNEFAEAHLGNGGCSSGLCIHPRVVIDVMAHDIERLTNVLNDFEVTTERLDGPVIGIKTTRRDFPKAYAMVVKALKDSIKLRANGRPFLVNQVKVKQLEDVERGYWGDYARHICDITFLTPKQE